MELVSSCWRRTRPATPWLAGTAGAAAHHLTVRPKQNSCESPSRPNTVRTRIGSALAPQPATTTAAGSAAAAAIHASFSGPTGSAAVRS